MCTRNNLLPRLTLIVWLIMLLTVLSKCQSPSIQDLSLAESFNTTQTANTYQYYSLTFNITNKLLEITLDSDSKYLIGIYLSIHPTGSNQAYYTYPNQSYNTHRCSQSSLDTCIIRLDKYNNLEITVYFSVYVYDDGQYELFAAQDDYYNVNIFSRYSVDFSDLQSGILKLSGDQLIGMEQVVMVLTYNTSGVVGKFKVKAAVDEIPEGYTYLSGVSVGAFNKILKLQPIQNTSNYFIIIEGQKGTKFSLHFDESMPSSPTIAVNSSVIYYTRTNMSYHTVSRFQMLALPLFIRLDSYLGYGVFSINYCGGLMETTFQNINGQNGEIAITPIERINCKTKMSASGSFGLLAENLQINVTNIHYEFGYKISLFEGDYPVTMHLNQQIFGIFLYFEQSRIYQLEIPTEETNSLSLSYNQITQVNGTALIFEIQECQKKKLKDKCKTIISSNGLSIGQLQFTPKANSSYDVKITYPNASNSTVTLQYMLEMYSQTKASTILSPSKLYLEEIQENQFQFYEINLTQIHDEQGILIKNLTQLKIHIKQLNGEVSMLSSLTIPQPTYEKSSDASSDIVYNWGGSTIYYVNETTQMIYIGVKGYEESIYYLHFTLNVDADIPAKYTKVADGTENNFILSAQNTYQLISFSSHIIPYKIQITGNPLCIKFGHTLPLDQTCVSTLPQQFIDKVVYLNISNGDVSSSSFKFSVYINSGDYELDDKNPLLIGCVDTCYELVTVYLKESSNIIHQGRGNIFELSNPTLIVSNNYLNLSCSSYPCITKINATLPYSGQMTLYLESSGIQQIGWMGKPITFGTYPKKFIFQIKKWSVTNSIILYSEAMQLNAYYNVIDIHEGQTNILTYNFPTEISYEASSSGNPLRTIHTIVISDELIKKKNCKNRGSFCLVTLSLYPNLNIEYNQNYKKQGVGFISSNIYEYFIALNSPLYFSGKFSMSYFTHKQYDSEKINQQYRVNIQPLSNCHPKLYTGDNYRNPNFQDPNYDDSLIIPTNKWMNFTVLVEKPCNYIVTLTNTPFQSIIQNKYYDLQLTKGEVTVMYRSEYSSTSGFTIQIDSGSLFTKVDYILVAKVEGDIINHPTIKQNTFMAFNKSTLTVQQKSFYSLYAITIISKAQNIKLLVRKSGPILLTHNQEHSQVIQGNSIMSYRIQSTGSIALFLTTNFQRPQVTINKNYNSTNVLTAYITDKSSPWLYINASKSDLQIYDITINNAAGSPLTINILYEENDALAFRKIYEGIIMYDAFVSRLEMNCYTYQSQMLVGRKDITIDFVLGKNQLINLNNCQVTDSCFKLFYKAIAKDSLVKSSIELIKSNSTAYRLRVEFVPRQNYTFCFHTPNLQALNTEYYILLNDPSMSHLLQGQTLTQNYENVYDMYEIVEEGYNENILIELTACTPAQKNERVIVGSSNFIDSENGRFTDLEEYYKNTDSIFAKLSVQQGYYYLGVKNNVYMNEFLNIYTLKFQNMGSDQKLLANTWHLRQRKIVKIFKNSKNSLANIEVPQIINSKNDATQNNITITYTIHILNMKKYEDASRIPLSILARCPDYHQSKLNEGAKKSTNTSASIIKKTLTFYYQNIEAYQQRFNVPVFEIDQSQLPNKFNITGRIDVKVNSQQFSYYYDTTNATYDPADQSQAKGATILISITLIFCAILIIAVSVFVCYRRYMRNVESKKVAFEMTNFNQQDNNSTARRDQRQALTTPKSKVKGYGQFTDQV